MLLICFICACGNEIRRSVAVNEPGQPTEPEYFRFWLNGRMQTASAYRVRKANGASRMRLLADFPDSLRLSLFATPFLTGTQAIGSGNIQEESVKYARTHCDFYQQAGPKILRFYEVDTTKTSAICWKLVI